MLIARSVSVLKGSRVCTKPWYGTKRAHGGCFANVLTIAKKLVKLLMLRPHAIAPLNSSVLILNQWGIISSNHLFGVLIRRSNPASAEVPHQCARTPPERRVRFLNEIVPVLSSSIAWHCFIQVSSESSPVPNCLDSKNDSTSKKNWVRVRISSGCLFLFSLSNWTHSNTYQ